MDIDGFNVLDLSGYFRTAFDKEIFEEFEGIDDLEDYFLGAPYEFTICWDDYCVEEDFVTDVEIQEWIEQEKSKGRKPEEIDILQFLKKDKKSNELLEKEEIFEMEKNKRLKEYSKLYPSIDFEVGEAGWGGGEFYLAPKNREAFLLYARTNSIGKEMWDKFREKNINEFLLIKSVYDKTLPVSEKKELISLLSKRKPKNFNQHLEYLALNDESTDCRHVALGELYNSTKNINKKTLDFLLEDFPVFTLSENIPFALSVLCFGALKKRKNLENKFIDVLEVCKNNLCSKMEDSEKRKDVVNPYLFDKDESLFTDTLKTFMVYEPNSALIYFKSLISHKQIGWLVNKITKQFLDEASFDGKREYSNYLIKQNLNEISYLVNNSKELDKVGDFYFPKENLKEKILSEHKFFRLLQKFNEPLIKINHNYSKVNEEFIEKINKSNLEFRETCFRKENPQAEVKKYFNKTNKLINDFASSAKAILP